MKLTPRSIAVRTNQRIASSSEAVWPMWEPPTPMAETVSPVLPKRAIQHISFAGFVWARQFGGGEWSGYRTGGASQRGAQQ